jgi:hypothetical protein
LFALWKVAAGFSIGHPADAFSRAAGIWRMERDLRIPSEVAVQHGVLGHPLLVHLLDIYYLAGHLGAMAIVLAWLFLRHRRRYAWWRNVVAAGTAAALLIQLVSVAPPRLLPGLGFVDTAARYHESAYGLDPGFVDQLSSMPSIHVAWAALAAAAVVAVARSRARLLVLVHPLLTCYVVVATANHFWLDAVAALALVAAVLLAGHYGPRVARTARVSLGCRISR